MRPFVVWTVMVWQLRSCHFHLFSFRGSGLQQVWMDHSFKVCQYYHITAKSSVQTAFCVQWRLAVIPCRLALSCGRKWNHTGGTLQLKQETLDFRYIGLFTFCIRKFSHYQSASLLKGQHKTQVSSQLSYSVENLNSKVSYPKYHFQKWVMDKHK